MHHTVGALRHEVVQMFRKRLQNETVLDFAHAEQIRPGAADLPYDQTELPELGLEQIFGPAFEIVLQPLGNPRFARWITLRRKQVFDIPERQDILGHDTSHLRLVLQNLVEVLPQQLEIVMTGLAHDPVCRSILFARRDDALRQQEAAVKTGLACCDDAICFLACS